MVELYFSEAKTLAVWSPCIKIIQYVNLAPFECATTSGASDAPPNISASISASVKLGLPYMG